MLRYTLTTLRLPITTDSVRTGDRDFVFNAVKGNWRWLEHASQECKQDRAIVLAALRQNGEAFKFVDGSLREDKAVLLAALRMKPSLWDVVPEEVKDKRFVSTAAREILKGSVNREA
eukprot:TRINITY_DN2087_c7_g1_i1.p1 TRINITY_DN2087_c7_g1~~TRINITY_DN2087_c7_g1_i1.p1  ORF type:complete len:132 (+),score=26.49 TRINITY_DN2087_c7_g1_i1:46-396(+)